MESSSANQRDEGPTFTLAETESYGTKAIRRYTRLAGKGLIGVFVASIAISGGLIEYDKYLTNKRIKLITTGPVRADQDSQEYYLPSCSESFTTPALKVLEFNTIDQAQEEGFLPVAECEKDSELRQEYENWDGEEWDAPRSRAVPW